MPDYTGNDQRYADQNDELRQNAEFMPLGISFHGATRSERLDTETLAATPNSGAIHAVADQASGRRSAIRRCRGLPLTVGRVATWCRRAKDGVDRNRTLHRNRLQGDAAARAPDQNVGPAPSPRPASADAPTYSPASAPRVQSYGRRKHGPGEGAGAGDTDIEPDGVESPIVSLHRIGRDLLELTFHRLVTKNNKADARIKPAGQYAGLRPGSLRLGRNRRVSQSRKRQEREKKILLQPMSRKHDKAPRWRTFPRCRSSGCSTDCQPEPGGTSHRSRRSFFSA